jgi:hypothetical protein
MHNNFKTPCMSITCHITHPAAASPVGWADPCFCGVKLKPRWAALLLHAPLVHVFVGTGGPLQHCTQHNTKQSAVDAQKVSMQGAQRCSCMPRLHMISSAASVAARSD